MKLFFAAASPFARKVLACAIARGIDSRIETIDTNPNLDGELTTYNPLSKIPCLVTDDGRSVFDSPVICDYLDTIGEAPPLLPPTGSLDRLSALVMQALADGIMDAAVLRRGQESKPQDEARAALMTRQKAAIDRALATLEADPPEGLDHVGAIAVACALGYLDYRFAHEPWAGGHPRLAAWYEEVARQPALARTAVG